MMHRQLGRSSAQRGNMLITALLGLVVAGIGAVAIVNAKIDEQKRAKGAGEATVLQTIQGGVNVLISNSWQAFQAGGNVSYNGVTLAPSNVAGVITWDVSVAQLQGMGNTLPSGWTTTTSPTNGAAYRIRIERTPAGCSAAACSVEGRIWPDAPFSLPGIAGSTDTKVVGPILSRIGSDAGIALPGNPGQITGYGFSWATANPVAGSPQGIVMVRVGSTSAAFAQFVRIGDTRDPSLQGPLTVAGAGTFNSTLNVTGATTIGGATQINSTLNVAGEVQGHGQIGAGPAGGCMRTLMDSNGRFIARASDCTDRFRVSGQNGSASVADGSGLDRVVMDGNAAQLHVRDAASNNMVVLDGASGRVGGSMLNAGQAGTAGASCAGFQEGDLVRDSASDGTVLACRNGVWRRPGLQSAAAGAGCSTVGVVAVDGGQRGLICRNGAWRYLNDRVASLVAVATFAGNGSGSVPAPSCGSGGTADIILTSMESGSDYGGSPPRNRFQNVPAWTGSGWSINPVLIDSNGTAHAASFTLSAYSFAWQATTICNYGLNS